MFNSDIPEEPVVPPLSKFEFLENRFQSRFQPGDQVIVGDDVCGIVERVIFCRDMTIPLLLIEWWDRGEHRVREFNENDVRPRKETSNAD